MFSYELMIVNVKRCNYCSALKKRMSYVAGFSNTVFEIDVCLLLMEECKE